METNEETRKTRRETIQLLNAFLKLNSRTNKCRYGDALVKKNSGRRLWSRRDEESERKQNECGNCQVLIAHLCRFQIW